MEYEEMEYEEIMDMVITDLTERSVRRQREENKEIDQLIKRRVVLAEEIGTYVAGVDRQLKKFWRNSSWIAILG